MMIRLTLVALFLSTSLPALLAQLSTVQRASGFSSPVDLANAGDGSRRLFIVERAGIIEVLDSNYNVLDTYLDITAKVDATEGELGLLGLTFDPRFKSNGYFYVYYSNSDGGGLKTILERYKVSDPTADSAAITAIDTIVIIPQFADNHNGGDLNFGRDGYLYCGLGDGGNGNGPGDSSQIMTTLLGKLIRVDTATLDVEIWHLGLRNPWRFSFDSYTWDLWIADVGQGLNEEVNFVPADSNVMGINYGWNCWEGTDVCGACNNMTGCPDPLFPIYEYSHPSSGGAITGGFVTRGLFYNDYSGYYVFAGYIMNFIRALGPGDTVGVTGFDDRITSFGLDEWGRIFAVSNSGGRLLEIVDASAITSFASFCQVTNTNDSGPGSLRAAIDCASPGDTVHFHPSLMMDTISVNSVLEIDKEVVIYANEGQGIYLDGTSLTNTIHVMSNGDVEIYGLKILGGNGTNGVVWNEGELILHKTAIDGDDVSGSIFVNDGQLEMRAKSAVQK